MVIVRAQSGQLAALEGHAFGLAGQLVVVGVEIQGIVPEIVYREGVAVLVPGVHGAHAAYRAGAPGIDAAEGVLLVVVMDAVLVRVQFHVLLSAGEHEAAVAVLLRGDVPCRAYREQAGVELVGIRRVALQGGQPLAVAQCYLITVLAPAHVHRLSLYPPFGLAAHFFGYLLQRLVAVLALVINDDEFRAVHLPHFPVGRVVHAVVDALHDHGHVFPRRGGQREHGLGVAVRGLQHEEAPHQALDAVQLQIVLPLALAFLRGLVLLRQPVALAHEVRAVVHVKRDMLIVCEGEGQDIVALHLLLLGAAVIGRHLGFHLPVFVVYRQNHVRTALKCHYMMGTGSRNFTLNRPA